MATGDLYYWDYDLGNYVLQEKEVEYVFVEEDPANDIESSDLSGTVSELEMQVNELEQDVLLLSDEVSVLSEYDVSSDHNLGTTNQAIFSGLVCKVPFGQHYVYWRDDQYSYKFAYGDLSLEGSEFVSDDIVTICSYDTVGTGYSTYYTWSVTTDTNFSLSVSDRLVYSDLGNYPSLGEREVQKYAAVTAYVLFGGVLFVLFDRLRLSCFRR